jgi:hypothetical protein
MVMPNAFAVFRFRQHEQAAVGLAREGTEAVRRDAQIAAA